MMPTMTDTRGRESTTLTFVTSAFITVLVKFILAGLTVPGVGVFPPMGAGEFGTAVGLILAIWLGREWTEKRQ